jgi:hypothetical protein
MIARFTVLLPFILSVRQGDDLPVYELEQSEYRIRIYPPCSAAVDPSETETVSSVPQAEVLKRLRPAESQTATELIKMDKVPTIQANLFQIDFIKPDFDRRHSTATTSEEFLTEGDPSLKFIFDLVNRILLQVRTITRGSPIRPVGPDNTLWRLDYMTDNEEELPHNPEFFRKRMGARFSWRVIGLNANIWNRVISLPADFSPPTWDTLILDAEALLPDVDAAIVVASSALESFIAWALDQLAPLAKVDPKLWNWINSRDDWYQRPSVSDQYNVLLKILTRKTLKDEARLWDVLMNIRQARDKFSHAGTPLIGGKEVNQAQAYDLVGKAKEIIDWVEKLLPENKRRPKLEKLAVMDMQKVLFAPADTEKR